MVPAETGTEAEAEIGEVVEGASGYDARTRSKVDGGTQRSPDEAG